MASGSLLCHLNLTGLTLSMKSRPTGRSTTSVLSLASDKELIDVWLQRKLEIALLPKVIWLVEVPLLGSASYPKQPLLYPVVILSPAWAPTIVILVPCVPSFPSINCQAV